MPSPRDPSEKKKRGRPRLGEEPSHYFLRVCMLEDSCPDVLSKEGEYEDVVLNGLTVLKV